MKIITKAVWIVSLVSLFTDIASEMLYPVMPIFLKSIGFSVVLIGILEGFAEAVAGLSKGYFGNLSDSLGKRVPFIRLGYLLSAVSKPMMAILTFPWWIFTSRTIDRLGKGLRTSARDALLSDESSPENKGRVFGFHRSMDTLGAAIGPCIALLFLYFLPGNYKGLFLLAFLPGIVAVSLTLILRDTSGKDIAANSKPGFFSYLGYWKTASQSYRRLVLPLLIFALFNSSDAFLLLFLKYKGFADTQIIGFYVVYNLLYALLSFPVGIVADRIGLKKVLVAGILLFSVAYGWMSFATSFTAIVSIFSIYALYAAATEGISKALISRITTRENMATAIGFYSGFSSLAVLVASTLGGILWFEFSPKVMFIVSCIGTAAAALMIAYLKIENKKA